MNKQINIRPRYVSFALWVFGLMLISACGDDEGKVVNPWRASDTLVFAYPYPGQQEVPTSGNVVLRFSTTLSDEVSGDVEDRLRLADDAGNAVPFTPEVIDGGRGLVLKPRTSLSPNTHYRLSVSEAGLGRIDDTVFKNFQFHTMGAHAGFADAVGSDGFKILGITPLDPDPLLAGIEDARINDMSTLRMVFNRPLDPATTVYGKQITLVDDQGQLIDASVLLQGRYLILDPRQDLDTVEYTLALSGLRSRDGSLLPEVERQFTPMGTQPRETTVIKVGSLGEQQPDLQSQLTGRPVNQVPLDSFIIGDSAVTELTGSLAADLGFVPDFADAVPLRVPAGTVLRGAPVDVNILGEIPAGIDTGDLQITLLSDANGYLIPNPFSTEATAPRYALLRMDAAMTAEGTIANAALSQNLLNIQVVGLAIVEDGKLVLDAISVVDPDILGLEKAGAQLSFHMESFAGQRNPPMPEPDLRPLELQSWSPGEDFQANTRPGDPVILNFNKAIDPASAFLDGAINVQVNGTSLPPEDVSMRVDGATVILEGTGIVEHNQDVEIILTSQLRDTAGNPLSKDYTLDMRLDDLFLPNDNRDSLRAPLVAAVFPGYPCALTDARLIGERSRWRNGRCQGGQGSDPLFPVVGLFREYPIRVIFNRRIDPATVNGDTFFVERRDAGGDWQPVPGHLDVLAQRVEFFPDSPWRDGQLYRYTLRSEPTSPDCGNNAICTLDGAALQTRQLSQSSDTAPAPREGGPDMVNHFVVTGDDQRYTLVSLRSLPTVDVNANLQVDNSEQGATDDNGVIKAPANHLRLELRDTGGVITNANLGCSIGEDCPEKRFAFVSTGALQAGPREYDSAVSINRRLIDDNPDTDDRTTGAVRVSVFPTTLTTTGVFLEARALGLITIGLETGPLVLRLLPEGDSPFIEGYITETEDGPWFSTTFDLLIDAPELEPRLIIELGHDIRSKRVNNVTLEGPLRFVDDGRLILKVSNPDPLTIPANIDLIGIGLASVELEAPPLGVDLTFTFLPVKDF